MFKSQKSKSAQATGAGARGKWRVDCENKVGCLDQAWFHTKRDAQGYLNMLRKRGYSYKPSLWKEGPYNNLLSGADRRPLELKLGKGEQ